MLTQDHPKMRYYSPQRPQRSFISVMPTALDDVMASLSPGLHPGIQYLSCLTALFGIMHHKSVRKLSAFSFELSASQPLNP